jgi:hypothetical protein
MQNCSCPHEIFVMAFTTTPYALRQLAGRFTTLLPARQVSGLPQTKDVNEDRSGIKLKLF